MKKLLLAAIFMIIFLPALLTAGHNHPHHNHNESAPHDINPLIEEMHRLNDVFTQIVSAVALADAEAVHTAIESMHGAMEKTHEGIHAETVKLPKNAHRIKEFIKMDREFHSGLEELAKAAEKKDQQKMQSLTKKLFDGCINCHQTFRK
ncbi:MAG: cytochrome c [Nitrospirae bacterium]|nr:cytochrome c [Nitrospirota bacterium]